MALATATITGDIADMLGVDFDTRRTKIWVTTNVPDDTVIDTLGNQIRLGSGRVTFNSDGTFSADVWVPGAGSNPASWQTTFHVNYLFDRAQKIRAFGPFTITASADLADLVDEQEVPPSYMSQAVAELQGYVDQAQALVLSDLGTTDGQTRALIENPASQTATALAVSIADTAVVYVEVPTGGPLPARPVGAVVAWISDINPEANMDDADFWVPFTSDAELLDEPGAVALVEDSGSDLLAAILAATAQTSEFIPANRFRDTSASTTTDTALGAGNGTKTPVRTYPTALGTYAAAMFRVPASWNSFAVYVVSMPASATTGQIVRWNVTTYATVDTVSNSNAGTTVGSQNETTAGQYIQTVTYIGAVTCVPNEERRVTVARLGTTESTYGTAYTGAAGFVGLRLVRTS